MPRSRRAPAIDGRDPHPCAVRRPFTAAPSSSSLADAELGENLVEQIGGRVEVVDSSTLNFKITTAEDLRLAELVVAARLNS